MEPEKLIEAFSAFCDVREAICEEMVTNALDSPENMTIQEEIKDAVNCTTGEVEGALMFLFTCKARRLLSKSQFDCLAKQAKITICVLKKWLEKVPSVSVE
jgi:hypothetical protein